MWYKTKLAWAEAQLAEIRKARREIRYTPTSMGSYQRRGKGRQLSTLAGQEEKYRRLVDRFREGGV